METFQILARPKSTFLPSSSRLAFILSLMLILFVSGLSSEETKIQPRKASKQEMGFHFYPQEGYFQAWNYSFTDEQTWIFATYIISNLGPGTRNCGVSLVVYDKENGTRFYTKEFSKDELKTEAGKTELEIYNNSVTKGEQGPEIKMDTDSAQLFLNYKTGWSKAVSMSGGKIPLPVTDRFVQADMAFSFVPVQGYLIINGNKIELNGRGGMEHLLTNYEVYKYSRRWELYRSQNSVGEKLYTGGFIGNDNFPGGEIRTVSVMDAGGKILFSAKVHGSEALEMETEPFSNYELPIKERFHLDSQNSCSLTLTRKQTVGQISVLSNISAVLRFFVRLFFTRPYQLYYISDARLDCKQAPEGTGTLPKDPNFKGIFSYYLINP
ncbi:hypothetical protein EHQ53_05645 [Leptospira langatensis]|uniref:Svf1-like C-terminal domain-containing protein n=2 Tax=Leptospira langatensis TaxID=2484983 RepID=A0A5F1ZXV4_9LEPT|nr:hypothetical protein EHO57_06480 [Leptospira langatensis]TGL42405.1 hypothetical protein EHQ53_05645 [Leptospira langatensis]